MIGAGLRPILCSSYEAVNLNTIITIYERNKSMIHLFVVFSDETLGNFMGQDPKTYRKSVMHLLTGTRLKSDSKVNV